MPADEAARLRAILDASAPPRAKRA
jgi:hypothetical protein